MTTDDTAIEPKKTYTRSKRPCIVDGCWLVRHSHGLCTTHSTRLKRYGDVHIQGKIGQPRGATTEQKFWSRVAITADVARCWLWQGWARKDGYGVTRRNNQRVLAHRLSYELFHGRVPTQWVLHSCDTPLCVNPHHLREGTHQDNMDDMKARNRGRKAKVAFHKETA
jgi:hypothetical protein